MSKPEQVDPDFVRRLARTWYGAELPEHLAETYAAMLTANRKACAEAGAGMAFDAAPTDHAATLDHLAEGG